jgi:hypothetical protein
VLEELLPHGAVHVDTDGGIVPSTINVSGWIEKHRMDAVEIRSPQAYRWQCPDCPNCQGRHPADPWHYKVSGVRINDPLLPMLFEHHPENQLLRVRSPGAIAIPAQSLQDAKRWVAAADVEADIPDETL